MHLGSFSCWNTHPSFNQLAAELTWSWRIWSYSSFCELYQCHMMLPPPCLTIGTMFLCFKVLPLLLQTYQFSLWPNNSIFVSRDHETFVQKAYGLSMQAAANFSRAWRRRLCSRHLLYQCNVNIVTLVLQEFPMHDKLEPWWFLLLRSSLSSLNTPTLSQWVMSSKSTSCN